jgi:uncharacterized protein YkwD
MRLATLHLLAVAALMLAGCDDFDLGYRPGSRPSNSESGRRIIVNGGEDTDSPAPSADGGPYLPPGTHADAGVPSAPKPDSSAPPPALKPDASPAGTCGNAFETEVFNLVNQERAKKGLKAFLCDLVATKVAHDYSQVMCDKHWFNHTGPDGSSPFQRMEDAGIQFSTAGENIAAGQKSPASVMQSWMNSAGHRANILGNYTYIGVGYVACSGGNMGHYWTQDFWK